MTVITAAQLDTILTWIEVKIAEAEERTQNDQSATEALSRAQIWQLVMALKSYPGKEDYQFVPVSLPTLGEAMAALDAIDNAFVDTLPGLLRIASSPYHSGVAFRDRIRNRSKRQTPRVRSRIDINRANSPNGRLVGRDGVSAL